MRESVLNAKLFNFSEPINIFQHINRTDSELTIPIRLCYHRGVHYNSLVDPNNASLGVGLGLPGLKPGMADKNMVRDALAQSDNTLTEQKMIEDKIKATDWEATNEAIEEQVDKILTPNRFDFRLLP